MPVNASLSNHISSSAMMPTMMTNGIMYANKIAFQPAFSVISTSTLSPGSISVSIRASSCFCWLSADMHMRLAEQLLHALACSISIRAVCPLTDSTMPSCRICSAISELRKRNRVSSKKLAKVYFFFQTDKCILQFQEKVCKNRLKIICPLRLVSERGCKNRLKYVPLQTNLTIYASTLNQNT